MQRLNNPDLPVENFVDELVNHPGRPNNRHTNGSWGASQIHALLDTTGFWMKKEIV
jgi:hypothetical protein